MFKIQKSLKYLIVVFFILYNTTLFYINTTFFNITEKMEGC